MSGAVWVPSGPGSCLPPAGQAPLLPGSAWAAASLRHGRSEFARFISLLSPGAPAAAEGTPPRVPAPPDGPGRSARALTPSLALPRGLSPPVVGTALGQPTAKAAGRGCSVFRAPLSFLGPLGCVVLLAVGLREETRLVNQEKLQIPTSLATRAGEARCWAFLVLGGWKRERTKRMVGIGRLFSVQELNALHTFFI